jgi:hypothetical protein
MHPKFTLTNAIPISASSTCVTLTEAQAEARALPIELGRYQNEAPGLVKQNSTQRL